MYGDRHTIITNWIQLLPNYKLTIHIENWHTVTQSYFFFSLMDRKQALIRYPSYISIYKTITYAFQNSIKEIYKSRIYKRIGPISALHYHICICRRRSAAWRATIGTRFLLARIQYPRGSHPRSWIAPISSPYSMAPCSTRNVLSTSRRLYLPNVETVLWNATTPAHSQHSMYSSALRSRY